MNSELLVTIVVGLVLANIINTLSECFTLLDEIDEAKTGLEHLKSLKQSRVSDSAIFKLIQDKPDRIEVKRI